MTKKKIGKFVALATVSGVIAAGISYFLKYKSFNHDLDEDFHDFEGDDEFDGELPHESETPSRTYVTLSEKKDGITEAAMEGAKQTGKAVSETVSQAAGAAEDAAGKIQDQVQDQAQNIGEKAEDAADSAYETAQEMSEMVKNAVTETAQAVKNAVESNSSTTIEEDEI